MSAASSDQKNDEDSSFEMKEEDYAYLQTLPGNKACVDCGRTRPDWGSPALGILFCFQCSGKHRGLGTHVSFVRSVKMDAWTDAQMALMKAGGNTACNEFLTSHGVEKVDKVEDLKEKYDTAAARLYKKVLLARVRGEPEPTVLEEPAPVAAQEGQKRTMEGFGSSPPPAKKKRKRRAGGIFVAVGVAVAATVMWCLRRSKS